MEQNQGGLEWYSQLYRWREVGIHCILCQKDIIYVYAYMQLMKAYIAKMSCNEVLFLMSIMTLYHIYVHACLPPLPCTFSYMHTHIHIIYICIYTCTSTRVHIYTHTSLHTCIHTYIYSQQVASYQSSASNS